MTPAYIGIDVATSGVRVLAVDERGRRLGHATRPLPRPERDELGGSTQPSVQLEAVAQAIVSVLGQLGAAQVAAIAVTATSGSVVGVDAAGRPVGAVRLYNDSAYLAAEPAWACVPTGLARMAWIRRTTNGIAAVRHVNDVVAGFLCGQDVATDTSHGLKSGIDPISLSWPLELARSIGLTEADLPSVTRPAACLGVVGSDAASVTGLRPGTPLIAGMTDGCAGQIAAGGWYDGAAVTVLGTTLVIKAVSAHPVFDDDTGVYSHRAPTGRWWCGGASNSGAGALLDEFPAADLASLDRRAAEHGPATALRYPLVGVGERFPIRDASATGFHVGTPADDVDRYRAVLEGVSFVERLGYRQLAALGAVTSGPVGSVGGGAQSPVWNEIRATVLDRPVTVPEEPSSAFGAAVLAAAGVLGSDLAAACARMCRTRAEVLPNSTESAVLDESFQRFSQEVAMRFSPSAVLPRMASAIAPESAS